jgi:hypothetical protein
LGTNYIGIKRNDSPGQLRRGRERLRRLEQHHRRRRAFGAVRVIAFNKVPGIEIIRDDTDAPTGNRFLNNSSFSKAGLVIDLGDNGVMPNEPRDRDPGFNNPQNSSVLSSATTTSEGSTTVKGSLHSTPGKSFLVQFFSTPSGQQAKILIGQRSVRIEARGNASLIFRPAARAVPAGFNVTATAMSADGYTSEYPASRKVVRPRNHTVEPSTERAGRVFVPSRHTGRHLRGLANGPTGTQPRRGDNLLCLVSPVAEDR